MTESVLAVPPISTSSLKLRSAGTASQEDVAETRLQRRVSCLVQTEAVSCVASREAGQYTVLMHCVYILQSLKDDSYYTGSTENVERRLEEHNSGTSKYSSTKRPFKLVWYCAFQDELPRGQTQGGEAISSFSFAFIPAASRRVFGKGE